MPFSACSSVTCTRLRAKVGVPEAVMTAETMEVRRVAPVPFIVVVAHLAGQGVDDRGVLPAGQLHEQAGGLAAVELGRALHGCGQAQPLAGGGDGDRVMDFGLDGDDMAHAIPSS